ncbi:MAG: hypothetical protein CSA79_02455 [Thiothrix nivea]|nr:MAG: hypothetical protein CSA79_02455 [Thiothrix nivea]
MLHNRYSFHAGRLLQNASALPGHVYRNSHNRQLLQSSVTTGIKVPETPDTLTRASQQIHAQGQGQNKSPPTQHKTQPRIRVRNTSRMSGKRVWKPGHGVVEKVDRLTGEIVHLGIDD